MIKNIAKEYGRIIFLSSSRSLSYSNLTSLHRHEPWIPKVHTFHERNIDSWAYVVFGVVGIVNGLYSIFHHTFRFTHSSKVRKCVNALQDERNPLPPGVSDIAFPHSIGFLDRNQPEIENLFNQEDCHFSILFGEPKVGKTTYLKTLMKGKKNILFFQFKTGDSAQHSIEKRIGIDAKGVETLPELFKIVEDSLRVVKSRRVIKDGIICMDEPLPLIVIEDSDKLTREEVLYIAKKLLNFYEKRLCSVIMSSNNRTYNYFLDNSRIGGFERFRRHKIEPVDPETMREDFCRTYKLTESNFDELVEVCGASFDDMFLILQYHEDLRYRDFARAVDEHIKTYEDAFRDLFRNRHHEETFLLFNLFDQLNDKGMVMRSYDLCFNEARMMQTMDRLLYDLGRDSFLQRHSKNDLYLTYYRPILKFVYPRVNIMPDVSQRRELYEKWKIENGYLDHEMACLVLEFKDPKVREGKISSSGRSTSTKTNTAKTRRIISGGDTSTTDDESIGALDDLILFKELDKYDDDDL